MQPDFIKKLSSILAALAVIIGGAQAYLASGQGFDWLTFIYWCLGGAGIKGAAMGYAVYKKRKVSE